MSKSKADFRVTIGVESKAYKQAIREVNKENREFKKQARESFKQAKLDADNGFGGIVAIAKKLAPAISAGAAAMKVAQTAMQENQRFTDEWARITESAKATYESFVDSLVNADFSYFFENMGHIVEAAREAADAIDNLDTTKIFSDLALSQIQLDASKYLYILRSKSSTEEEKAAAREGLIATRDKQMQVALDKSDANMQAFAATLASFVSNKGYAASASDFVETGADGRLQAKKGSLFEKYYGNGDLATYRKWDAIYKEELAERNRIVATSYSPTTGAAIHTYAKGNMSDAAFEELRAFLELSDVKLKEAFGYYESGLNDLRQVYDAMASDSRYISAGVASATKGGAGAATSPAKVYKEGSIGWLEERIAKHREDLKAATTQLAMDEANYWIARYERDLEPLKKASDSFSGATQGAIGGGIGLQGLSSYGAMKPISLALFSSKPAVKGEVEANEDLVDSAEIATEGLALVSDSLNTLGLTGKIADVGLKKTINFLGRALSFVGGIIGGGVGKALQIGGGIVGSFDSGGIVGGTSYRGDKLPAMVNSREMILNATQQKQLFDIINSGASGANTATVVVRGEDTYISLRNYGRRTGKYYLP